MKVVWSRKASRDIQGVHAYIASDNPFAADKLVARFLKSASLLAGQPHMGHLINEGGTRELVLHPNYILLYECVEDEVQVLKVFHAARSRARQEEKVASDDGTS